MWTQHRIIGEETTQYPESRSGERPWNRCCGYRGEESHLSDVVSVAEARFLIDEALLRHLDDQPALAVGKD